MAWFRCTGGNGGGSSSAPEISGRMGSSGPLFLNGRFYSGIASQLYAYFPKTSEGNKPAFDFTKPFKIHMKVKVSGLLSRSQALIGNSANYYNLPSFEFQPSSSTTLIWAGWSTNGSTWTASLDIPKSSMAFTANAWYTIEYAWDGSTFTLTVNDGNATASASVATAHFYQTSSGDVQLGTVSNSSNHYAANATFDLFDTYWEQDGTVIWGNKAA